jgi:hypothetical protein
VGLFWSYFKFELRLPFIQLPGPLAMLAEGAATLLDTVRDTIITLRDQFFADTCETVYLPKFARSRGIVRAPLEPEESFYSRVRLAYLWHKYGGRESAMQQVLEAYFGFEGIQIVNLRSEDVAKWAEFRVVINSFGTATEYNEDLVRWAVNEIKPARSLLEHVLPPLPPVRFRAGESAAGEELLRWNNEAIPQGVNILTGDAGTILTDDSGEVVLTT